MSSEKDREIGKDRCFNPFQKNKHKGTTLRRVSDNLRVEFPKRELSQIWNACRFEITNSIGRSSLNCDNASEIFSQVQSDTDIVVVEDSLHPVSSESSYTTSVYYYEYLTQ